MLKLKEGIQRKQIMFHVCSSISIAAQEAWENGTKEKYEDICRKFLIFTTEEVLDHYGDNPYNGIHKVSPEGQHFLYDVRVVIMASGDNPYYFNLYRQVDTIDTRELWKESHNKN